MSQLTRVHLPAFPFLFGRAFIEARRPLPWLRPRRRHFPSFLEGLSLRQIPHILRARTTGNFPSFLEGFSLRRAGGSRERGGALFPFLFGGVFIEAVMVNKLKHN